jgi:ribosomal protein S18 acetylase RimI-like enzyme
MSRTAIIERFRADEWPSYRNLRLRALTESPDAFGSTLAQELPRSDEEWEQRLLSGIGSATDLPLVARLGTAPVGLAWCRLQHAEHGTASLYQVWIAPEHRGCGIGRCLIETSVDWARMKGAQQLALSVTCGDTPARRVYEQLGFIPAGQPQPLRPGSDLMEQPMMLSLI